MTFFANRLDECPSYQAYEAALYKVFDVRKLAFQVKNLFVIPDYTTWFRGHIDPKLGR